MNLSNSLNIANENIPLAVTREGIPNYIPYLPFVIHDSEILFFLFNSFPIIYAVTPSHTVEQCQSQLETKPKIDAALSHLKSLIKHEKTQTLPNFAYFQSARPQREMPTLFSVLLAFYIFSILFSSIHQTIN